VADVRKAVGFGRKPGTHRAPEPVGRHVGGDHFPNEVGARNVLAHGRKPKD
jgi:hypothetical protein